MTLTLPAPKKLEYGQDFETWLSSVEVYLLAMNITKSEQKKNIVLHLLGPNMQEIYRNLPVEADEVANYEEMKRKLMKHYKPTVNPVVERHIFNTMEFSDEPVNEYIAKLRNQIKQECLL